MSSGKAAVRDLRYGRRGGGWAVDGDRARQRIEQAHAIRLEAIAHDNKLTDEEYADATNRKWPAESIGIWRELAVQARVRLADGLQLTEFEARAIDVDDLARRRS